MIACSNHGYLRWSQVGVNNSRPGVSDVDWDAIAVADHEQGDFSLGEIVVYNEDELESASPKRPKLLISMKT